MTFLSLLFSFLIISTPGEILPDPTPRQLSTVNKAAILQLVNEVRKTGYHCGDTYYKPAQALQWNEALEKAALLHTLDMEEKKFFNHTASDGSNPGNRIEKAGYTWQCYGENIAMGYRTEKEVVAGWLKSPGHCKNIMNPTFKEMGAARVGNYWTQSFAARQEKKPVKK